MNHKKICNTCGEKLALGENWTQANKTHWIYKCKRCVSAYSREWYRKNRPPPKQHEINENRGHVKSRSYRAHEKIKSFVKRSFENTEHCTIYVD